MTTASPAFGCQREWLHQAGARRCWPGTLRLGHNVGLSFGLSVGMDIGLNAGSGSRFMAWLVSSLFASLGMWTSTAQAAPVTALAWLTPPGQWHQVVKTSGQTGGPGNSAASFPEQVPLGSVWKLFVYSYLHATGAQEAEYRCESSQPKAGEEYCCDPGQRIGRDLALLRSCGVYFEPSRLGLVASDWQAFWAKHSAPPWLLSLSHLKPDYQLPPPALLRALQAVPSPARQAARQALLPITLRDTDLLEAVGSSPRFKTWSWFDAQGARWGGAAGWLADGSAFWLGAPGTGKSVLHALAPWLAEQWRTARQLEALADAAGQQAQSCVEVNFFRRYALAEVLDAQSQPVRAGPLRALPGGGAYQLRFANGVRLTMPGQLGFELHRIGPKRPESSEGSRNSQAAALANWQIRASLPLEDYVARVLDREGDARETRAAQALAITARTWLRQNASSAPGTACLIVDDDSRAQRVSPRPPSAAAQAVAAFTAGWVLNGEPVRYHLNQPGPQVLAWQQSLEASRAGASLESLLRQAFPQARLVGWNDETDCQALPQAAAWLAERSVRWRRQLHQHAGYEALESPAQVCQLQQGVPFADMRRNRVHVREWLSRDGRISLIHEYLHLAFKRHPKGRDEAFIEQLAQQLADT